MAKSKVMERLFNNLTIKSYDDREELLKQAKKEGFNSRQGTYVALAYAYQWWMMSIKDEAYMLQKFKSHVPEIKVTDVDKINMFVPTIKLIFDFTESKYYSRASEYALVLQYVHRMMDTDMYREEAENPSIVIAIIKDGDGIRKCVEAQRTFNNPVNANEATQTQINDHLQEACTKIYKGKKALSSLDLDAPKSSTGFVLMMGRIEDDGGVDVVEVMDADADAIFNLTKDEALKDVTGMPATLNFLGDTLAYLNVFGTNDTPIVTVEKDGVGIQISLDNTEDASIVIKATPLEPNILQGFTNRAHLSTKDSDWFMEKAQDRVHRRIYDIAANPNVQTAEVAYDMTSQINQAQKVIHFNAMNKATNNQVDIKDLDEADMKFKAGLGRLDIEEIYTWLKGWLEVGRRSAADRIIPVIVDDENLTFNGNNGGGSGPLVIPVNTGLAKGTALTYRMFGRELVKIFKQLYLNHDIDGFYISAPDAGLFEITAEDTLAAYSINIPTVLKGDVNHNPTHFRKLA